jgi:hypothetical protein
MPAVTIFVFLPHLKGHMSVKVPLEKKNGRPIPVMDTDLAGFPGEVWKPAPHFDDYEISNYGRVKSLPRVVETKAGYLFPVAEKIIKLAVLKDKEWISISAAMTRDGHRYSRRVARLVYDLFVGPLDYDNKSILVKRTDGDVFNLYFENLVLEDRGVELRTQVSQYDHEGQFIKTHVSVHDAGAELGIAVSRIKEAILENLLQGKKYYWRSGASQSAIAVPDKEQKKQDGIRARFRPVEQLSLEGQALETYESVKAAAAQVSGQDSSIILACGNPKRTAYGFRWRYLDTPRNALLQGGLQPASGHNGITPYNQPVYQYNMQGELLHRYRTPAEAAKAMGVVQGTITNAIKRQSQLANGYYWRYAERQDLVAVYIDVSAFKQKRSNYLNAKNRQVEKIDKNGKALNTFESVTAAASAMGVASGTISKACKKNANCKGHRWRYAPVPQ